MEKLEWLGYHMVKKFLRRYLYSFWRNSRMWQTDGLTDGHRMPAIAALCIASHGKNVKRVSVKPEKISWNFWNLSEIFQGKKISWNFTSLDMSKIVIFDKYLALTRKWYKILPSNAIRKSCAVNKRYHFQWSWMAPNQDFNVRHRAYIIPRWISQKRCKTDT